MSTPANALRRPQAEDDAAISILRGAVFLAFSLLICWQASMALGIAARDKPYEGWDEIATYNNARVVSGPHVAFSLRYGSLDTFLQILATQYFLLFDPAGPGEDRPAAHRTRLRRPRHHQGHLCRRSIPIPLECHPLGGVSSDRRRTHRWACTERARAEVAL